MVSSPYILSPNNMANEGAHDAADLNIDQPSSTVLLLIIIYLSLSMALSHQYQI
jgi:hypothetical protein